MNQNILDQFETEKGSEITFRNVATQQEADSLVMHFAERGINARTSKDTGNLDAVYVGENPLNKFEIIIRECDVKRLKRSCAT